MLIRRTLNRVALGRWEERLSRTTVVECLDRETSERLG